MNRKDLCRNVYLSLVTLVVSLAGANAAFAEAVPAPPGNHLSIEAVFVNYDANVSMHGQLTIVGSDFGFGLDPVVTLGEDALALDIVSASDTEIVAELPTDFPSGNYLLTVSTGFGQSQNDEFDLTLNPPEPAPPSPTLSVIEYSETCTVANNDFSVCAVDCPTDRVPTGGGFYMQGTLGNATPHPTVFQSNQFFNGWLVGVYNDLGMELEFTVNAECAKIE